MAICLLNSYQGVTIESESLCVILCALHCGLQVVCLCISSSCQKCLPSSVPGVPLPRQALCFILSLCVAWGVLNSTVRMILLLPGQSFCYAKAVRSATEVWVAMCVNTWWADKPEFGFPTVASSVCALPFLLTAPLSGSSTPLLQWLSALPPVLMGGAVV